MKTIYLLRHAKTEQPLLGQKDFERNLTLRGITNANTMAQRMVQANTIPQIIIASNAVRTTATAKIFAQQWKIPLEQIIFLPELYLANAHQLQQAIDNLSANINSAVIIAHNPGITVWANSQAGFLVENIPTCGVIGFSVEENDWLYWQTATKKLELYDWPKNGV